MFRTLREPFFIPYLGLMGSVLLLVPSLNGIHDYWFGTNGTFSDGIPIFNALSCFFGNQFARAFLQLRIHKLTPHSVRAASDPGNLLQPSP